MRTTIDAAGRLVIPKPLRDQIGLRPGTVDITADGTGLRIEPVAGTSLERRGGRLVIPPSGLTIDDEDVRARRHAEQK